MSYKGMSESELQNKIIDKLAFWNKHLRVVQEVPHGCRCTDIVLISKNNKTTIGIELKLHSWRKAYEQSLEDYRAFDKNYIAMPKPKRGWSEDLLELCKKGKVGLLEVDLSQPFPFKIIVQQNTVKESDSLGLYRNHTNHFINHSLRECFFEVSFGKNIIYEKPVQIWEDYWKYN